MIRYFEIENTAKIYTLVVQMRTFLLGSES